MSLLRNTSEKNIAPFVNEVSVPTSPYPHEAKLEGQR